MEIEVHPSGANVDPETRQLYTNFFDDTASPEGCVDTTSYAGSGRVRNRIAIVTGGTQAIGKTCVEVILGLCGFLNLSQRPKPLR